MKIDYEQIAYELAILLADIAITETGLKSVGLYRKRDHVLNCKRMYDLMIGQCDPNPYWVSDEVIKKIERANRICLINTKPSKSK